MKSDETCHGSFHGLKNILLIVIVAGYQNKVFSMFKLSNFVCMISGEVLFVIEIWNHNVLGVNLWVLN